MSYMSLSGRLGTKLKKFLNKALAAPGVSGPQIGAGVWGRGCNKAEISEEKRLFTE